MGATLLADPADARLRKPNRLKGPTKGFNPPRPKNGSKNPPESSRAQKNNNAGGVVSNGMTVGAWAAKLPATPGNR